MSDFKDDHRLKYHRWKNYLERDDLYPNQYLGEIIAEMSSFEENEMEADQKHSFLNTYFPQFIRSILEKRYYHFVNPDYSYYLDFLTAALSFCFKTLSKDSNGPFDVILNILDYNKNIYDKHYSPVSISAEVDLLSSIQKRYQKKADYFSLKHPKSLNVLFSIMIDFFGNHDGFDLLISHIRHTGSIDYVTQTLSLLISLEEVVAFPLWKKIMKKAYTESISTLEAYNEEELKQIQKHDLRCFFLNLQKLLDKRYSNEKTGRIVEACELEMAQKLLMTKYLEKRIYGITEIVGKIAQAKNLDEDNDRRSKGYYVYQNEFRETARWMDSEILLSWLDSRDLIGIIFGPASHHEIIKRSTDLVKFMYLHSRFTQDQLRNLWEVAFAKHEAEREALLGLIQELVPSLDSADLQFLYEKIQSVPYHLIDSQILQLAKSYTRLNSYYNPPHKKSRSASDRKDIDSKPPAPEMRVVPGEAIPLPPADYLVETPPQEERSFEYTQVLYFMWSLWQEGAVEGGVSRDVSVQAMTILKDSLINYFRYERLKFLVKCIENFKSNSMVIWSCDMMKALLESYPSVKVQYGGMDSKSSIISDLDNNNQLIQDLHKSLIQFKLMALDKAISMSAEDSTSSSDDDHTPEHRRTAHEEIFRQIQICKEGSLNYVEELRLRLEFLKYIYSNSSESLTPEHMRMLWEAFIFNASSESEAESFFDWLTSSTVSWPNRAMLSDELQAFIFTNLLLKIHPATYIPAAFKCFERFLISINKQYRLISNYGSDENLEVNDPSLIGIEALWEVMLQARSEEVFMSGSGLMKRVYRGLKSSSLAIQEDFIRTCMQYISSTAPVIVMDEESVSKISRCLILLIDFIQEFENAAMAAQDMGQEVHVTIKNQSKCMDQPREIVVALNTSMTWAQARGVIVDRLGSGERLEFLIRGNFIDSKQDHKTVEELGIDSNVKIFVNEDSADNFEAMNIEGVPPPTDLEASLGSLRMIFENLSDDLLTLALERSDNQVENAVALLTDDDNIEKLQAHLNKSRAKKKPVETYRLSNILSNTQDYFNLLFELFSFGNPRLNSKIWVLLSKIPVNEKALEEVRELEFGNDWNNLLDSRCAFKLLYNLEIVDSIISNSDSDEWKAKFLILGGFKHVYDILIGFKELGINPKDLFEARVLDFVLRIIRVYLQSLDKSDEVDAIVDYPCLISCIISIIESAIESFEETEAVLTSALDFLVIILAHNPSLLSEIYSKQVFMNLISNVLLSSQHLLIREAIVSSVSSIVATLLTVPEGLQSPLEYFWQIAISNFPTNNSQHCEEFFILAVNLISPIPAVPSNFVQQCFEFIYARETVEDRHLNNQDKVITGYLQVLRLILQKHPEAKHYKMLEFLYTSLFDLQEEHDSPPKFKHSLTRRVAFEVMLELCVGMKENADKLLDKLYIHHSTHKNAGSFDTDIKPRNSCGYVGLRNFGSTCYMNSLLQQIFLMEPVRNGILAAPISNQEDMEDNLLFQFKSVMANLLESEKEFYEPYGFCQAFKGYDGQAVNVRVQQDADEFLSLLFDKLEEMLKHTEQAGLLRNHIGGSLVHEIVSCEPNFPYHGQREEQFFRISLDVKNKKSLQEALDLYIKDDVLEGDNKYFCDEYNTKISAKKRCLISTLSNSVIIHLKRFEFDYSTMSRNKINDYCEFPIQVNFKNWAKNQDHADSYYEYSLSGVLLHSGVADSGHYTSIIKDRQSQRWFKFDDRYVESYNIENLKSDCFGGETVYHWGSSTHHFSQTKNAYMLIYERITPASTGNSAIESPEASKLEYIIQKIRSENVDFLRDLLYFDQSYFELLKNFIDKYQFVPLISYDFGLSETKDTKELMMLTKYIEEDESRASVSRDDLQGSEKYYEIVKAIEATAEPEDQGLKLIKLGTLFAYEMLVRAKNYEAFKYWTKTLLEFYLNHIKASIWFLNFLLQNKEILSEIILECRDPEIRVEFSSFISKILRYCSSNENDILLDKILVINLSSLPFFRYSGYMCSSLYTKRYRSVSSRFIEYYLTDFFTEFRRNTRRLEDYLLILKEFATCGNKHKVLLVEIGTIQELLNNINENDKFSSNLETDEIFSLLSYLICFSRTQAIRESGNLPSYFIPSGAELESHTENFLSGYHIKRNLINNFRMPSVERIILHLCWENIKFSCDYLEEFSLSLVNNKYDNSKVTGYLKIIEKLLLIDDSGKAHRVKEFLEITPHRSVYSMQSRLTFFEQIQKIKESYCPFVMNIILWWSDLMKEDHVMKATKDHSPQFRWITVETFHKLSPYMIHDYLNKGTRFEYEFNEAIRKFRLELESDSEESVEIELDRYNYVEANPVAFKDNSEESSTDSDKY